VKPRTEFGRNRTNSDGLASYCKPCFRTRANAQYRKKRAALGLGVREPDNSPDGFKRCADCRIIKQSSDFAKALYQSDGLHCFCKQCNNRRQRKKRLDRLYGMTEDQLSELVLAQGGYCAICRERAAVHVDHDHMTGAVRGVLCFPCNAALGQFKDRIDLLMSAATYLETTTWQKTRVCTGVYRLTSPRPAARRSSTSSALQRLICSRRAVGTSPPG